MESSSNYRLPRSLVPVNRSAPAPTDNWKTLASNYEKLRATGLTPPTRPLPSRPFHSLIQSCRRCLRALLWLDPLPPRETFSQRHAETTLPPAELMKLRENLTRQLQELAR